MVYLFYMHINSLFNISMAYITRMVNGILLNFYST